MPWAVIAHALGGDPPVAAALGPTPAAPIGWKALAALALFS
jgi:hypothetical protein